jgi:hypothetical protein
MNTEQIIADLHAERGRIDGAIAALEALNRTGRRRGRPYGKAAQPKRGRRRMSADARRRIAAAMRARWAAKKKRAQPQQKSAAKQKRRGGISAAGRKRLSEMMKQRWAERRKRAEPA